MGEEVDNAWKFEDIFASNESRVSFIVQTLLTFEEFPPDTRLNCDDYYSIMSVISHDIPYSFVAFVCECVDPSIASGTLLSHRIAFGNFLLCLPCCILFPQFMHRYLTLFKTSDKLRKGIISRSLFLSLLKETFMAFLTMKQKDKKEEEEEDDYSSEEETREPELTEYEPTIDPMRLPARELLAEVTKATASLDESSVQTLLFVMWQKEPQLLDCKARVRSESENEFSPEDYAGE